MAGPFTTPVAESVPFEPGRNPDYNGLPGTLTAENVQDAIEEAIRDALGRAARLIITCGYDRNARKGRFLEFYKNNCSRFDPFIVAEDSEILTLSMATKRNSTGEVTVYVNGSAVATLSMSGTDKAWISGLAVPLSPGDEISAKVTDGLLKRVNFYIGIRVLTS